MGGGGGVIRKPGRSEGHLLKMLHTKRGLAAFYYHVSYVMIVHYSIDANTKKKNEKDVAMLR